MRVGVPAMSGPFVPISRPAPAARPLEWLPLGAWRSLVARTVRVGEVAGSNPAAPIVRVPTLATCLALDTSRGRSGSLPIVEAGD